VEGFWPIFFLAVVLKIPVLASLWLVWWASKPVPEPDEAEGSDGGFKRFRPEPTRPRGPRRGPHGGGNARPIPSCPPGGRAHVLTPPAPVRAGAAAGRGAATRHEREPAQP
jgi:hypothetical protein